MSEQFNINEIHSSGNVRMDEGLDESFLTSVKLHGVLVPVTLTKNDDGYNLVAGHRRLAAAKLAGHLSIPGFVVDVTDPQDRVVMQLVENIQRRNLDPIEEALAYQNLANEGIQQKDIAERVGVTQPHISKRISLLKLSDANQNRVRTGNLDVNIAVDLAKIRDHTAQDRLVKDGVNEHKMAMALKRQKEEDDLAKFIKRVGQNVELSEAPDLTAYKVLGRFDTYDEYNKADIPEDAITVASSAWGGQPSLVVYVPSYGNNIVDAEEQDEKKAAAKAEREANRERDSHLKTIVAKAGVKDVTALSAAFLFDRLVTANTARRISVLLDLDPNVGGYVHEERLAPDENGEIKTRKNIDYVKLVNDWYSQGAKESVQALMAAIIVGYDGIQQLEEFLSDKGVPTVKELMANQD